MTPEQRAELRAAGWAKAAALPPISHACATRIAELLREAINAHIRGGGITTMIPDGDVA
jgi:hypothetical protein